MSIVDLLLMTSVMCVLAAVPSTSLALVVVRSATSGFLSGVAVTLGIILGDIIFITLAILGMTAVAEAMGILFIVIKYVGGAYLVWFGIGLLKSNEKVKFDLTDNSKSTLLTSFLSGLVITLGDMKAIIFYASLFPLFVDLASITISATLVIVLITVFTIAVVSCLGHNLSFKGIFGHPRSLVTDATQRLCNAIQSTRSENSAKFLLMNTTGNRNRDIEEQISLAQKCVIGLLRLLLPPHLDNELAADYLRTKIGQRDTNIEWVVVRPDSLINKDKVTEYKLYASPIRSAIFDAGNTSRINVGHFMAELICDNDLWNKWKGQMPVIYNKDSTK